MIFYLVHQSYNDWEKLPVNQTSVCVDWLVQIQNQLDKATGQVLLLNLACQIIYYQLIWISICDITFSLILFEIINSHLLFYVFLLTDSVVMIRANIFYFCGIYILLQLYFIRFTNLYKKETFIHLINTKILHLL